MAYYRGVIIYNKKGPFNFETQHFKASKYLEDDARPLNNIKVHRFCLIFDEFIEFNQKNNFEKKLNYFLQL